MPAGPGRAPISDRNTGGRAAGPGSPIATPPGGGEPAGPGPCWPGAGRIQDRNTGRPGPDSGISDPATPRAGRTDLRRAGRCTPPPISDAPGPISDRHTRGRYQGARLSGQIPARMPRILPGSISRLQSREMHSHSARHTLRCSPLLDRLFRSEIARDCTSIRYRAPIVLGNPTHASSMPHLCGKPRSVTNSRLWAHCG
jgi:hypothetical protein